jgi:hypothetical protein
MFKRVILFFSCTVFLLSAAPQRDVAFLLQHADFELKNPLLFQEGLYDLALVFEHGFYRDDPVLERKFINLVRYAQRRGEHCSGDALIALEDLSERVFFAYRGTRYALDLAFVRSKNKSSCFDETANTSLLREKKEKISKKQHAKERGHDQKQEVSLLDWWGCHAAYRSRSNRTRATSKKNATTRKAKTARPKKERVKKMTKKEKAALEAREKELIQNISSAEQGIISEVRLDVAVKPVRKKQTRKKKESIAYIDDVSGAMNDSEAKPKRKRASKKKEAFDLQNQNAS